MLILFLDLPATLLLPLMNILRKIFPPPNQSAAVAALRQIPHHESRSSKETPSNCAMTESFHQSRRATSCNHSIHPIYSIPDLCPLCSIRLKIMNYAGHERDLKKLKRTDQNYVETRDATRRVKLDVVEAIRELEEQAVLEQEWDDVNPDTHPDKGRPSIYSTRRALAHAERSGYFVSWPEKFAGQAKNPDQSYMKARDSNIHPLVFRTASDFEDGIRNEQIPKRRVSWGPELDHCNEKLHRKPNNYHRGSLTYEPGLYAPLNDDGYENTSFFRDASYFNREESLARLSAGAARRVIEAMEDGDREEESPGDPDTAERRSDLQEAESDGLAAGEPASDDETRAFEDLKAEMERLQTVLGTRFQRDVEMVLSRSEEEILENPDNNSHALTQEVSESLSMNGSSNVKRNLSNMIVMDDLNNDRDSGNDKEIEVFKPPNIVELPANESDPKLYDDLVSRFRRRSDDDPVIDPDDEASLEELGSFRGSVQVL